jgi:uncharacterized membrane protein
MPARRLRGLAALALALCLAGPASAGSDGAAGPEADDSPLICAGTEPFWSLEIDGGKARYSAPGEDETEFEAGGRTPAQGLRGHFVIRLKDRDSATGPEGLVVVTRSHGFCSDNMSDREYPFTGTLIRPHGAVFGGCCRPRN